MLNDKFDAVECEGLLSPGHSLEKERKNKFPKFIVVLCTLNLALIALSLYLGIRLHLLAKCPDQSLGVYSPANEAVEYIEHKFISALANTTEYMGFPDDEIDKRWSDLYNFGTSVISKEEARNLATPTIPIPGTQDYLIQLDVWHQLHCLNDLRKLLYPERFQMLERLNSTGKINRNSFAFRHWDHCVDALRQNIMCSADIAPISFHVNIPFNRGIFPRLSTTHTCRNFTKIQEWAKKNEAPDFEFMIDDQKKLQKIIDDSGFDHSPEENMEGLYWMFPGNKFFKHWREHEVVE